MKKLSGPVFELLEVLRVVAAFLSTPLVASHSILTC